MSFSRRAAGVFRWTGAVAVWSCVAVSLLVHVFVRDENGKMEVLDTPDCCSDLAGFESFRTTVWGSDAVRALGARFFPVLATGDLTVEPADVPDFLRECNTIRINLDAVAPRDSATHSQEWYVEAISWRLANIQIQAGRALGCGGGVLVW